MTTRRPDGRAVGWKPHAANIYSEHPTGALYLDKPSEAESYARIWADLDRVALDQAASSRVIERRAKEWSE